MRVTPAPLAVLLATAPAAADELHARAQRLHASAIVVDTHEDVPEQLLEKWADLATPGATPHVDLPRLRTGGVGAAFFSVYLPSETEQAGTAAKQALEVFDLVDRVVEAHPDRLVAATSVADIRAARRAGKVAILKGVEGGHQLENSLARLRSFARLGARYLTLTHNRPTAWADSAGPYHGVSANPAVNAPHGGLTAFGKRVVRELNRLGVAVDISHVSDAVVTQALQVSRAPVFASHSSCRALASTPRNLSDDQIRAIAAGGGVVMINFGSAFLDQRAYDAAHAFTLATAPRVQALEERYAKDPTALAAELKTLRSEFQPLRASWTAIVDHLEHVMRLAPGAAGLGTDVDGVDDLPTGFDDIAALPRLTEELLRRGHSEAEVRGVLGENFLRFLGRVEATAASLKGEPPDLAPFEPERDRAR
jgi:membrane dipeptidase